MQRVITSDSIRLAGAASAVALLAAVVGGCEAASAGSHTAPAGRSWFWAPEQEPSPTVRLPLIVAAFDVPGHQTHAGDAFGAWEGDPGDRTQSCRVRLVDTPRVGDQGFSLMVEYDVDSPNPAYNGLWMKLPHVRLRDYEALAFKIKGDPERGFTQRVTLELKGNSRVARFLLEGIQSEWKQVRIPLRAFDDIRGLWEATEFVVVFEDQSLTERVGTLYLDNIVFEPGA